jgi:hypothetical protein
MALLQDRYQYPPVCPPAAVLVLSFLLWVRAAAEHQVHLPCCLQASVLLCILEPVVLRYFKAAMAISEVTPVCLAVSAVMVPGAALHCWQAPVRAAARLRVAAWWCVAALAGPCR